jgi:hypothetical protein
MATDPGLDARLLVGADDAILGTEGLSPPSTGVKVEDHAGLLGEVRVAGEEPVLVPPGLDRVTVEDTPESATTDRLARRVMGSRGQIGQRLAAQGRPSLGDYLAGDRLDDGLIAGGKTRPCGPVPARPGA